MIEIYYKIDIDLNNFENSLIPKEIVLKMGERNKLTIKLPDLVKEIKLFFSTGFYKFEEYYVPDNEGNCNIPLDDRWYYKKGAFKLNITLYYEDKEETYTLTTLKVLNCDDKESDYNILLNHGLLLGLNDKNQHIPEAIVGTYEENLKLDLIYLFNLIKENDLIDDEIKKSIEENKEMFLKTIERQDFVNTTFIDNFENLIGFTEKAIELIRKLKNEIIIHDLKMLDIVNVIKCIERKYDDEISNLVRLIEKEVETLNEKINHLEADSTLALTNALASVDEYIKKSIEELNVKIIDYVTTLTNSINNLNEELTNSLNVTKEQIYQDIESLANTVASETSKLELLINNKEVDIKEYVNMLVQSESTNSYNVLLVKLQEIKNLIDEKDTSLRNYVDNLIQTEQEHNQQQFTLIDTRLSKLREDLNFEVDSINQTISNAQATILQAVSESITTLNEALTDLIDKNKQEIRDIKLTMLSKSDLGKSVAYLENGKLTKEQLPDSLETMLHPLEVQTLEELNSLIGSFIGQNAYCVENDKFYRYTNSGWVELTGAVPNPYTIAKNVSYNDSGSSKYGATDVQGVLDIAKDKFINQTNAIEDLETKKVDKLTYLNEQSTQNNNINKNTSDIEYLKTDVEKKINTDVFVDSQNIQDIKIDKNSQDIKNISSLISTISGDNNSSLSNLTTTLDDITNQLKTKVDKSIYSSEQTTQNTNITKNTDDITTLKIEQTTQNINITKNTDDITTLKTEQNTQNMNISKNANDITALKGEQITQNTNIAKNTSDITQNTSDIAKNTNDISTLKNDMITQCGSVSTKLDGVITDLNTVKTTTTNIKTDTGNIKTDTTSIKTDVTSIKNESALIKADTTSIKTSMLTVSSDTVAIKQTTASTSTNVTSILNKVNALQTQVDNINSSLVLGAPFYEFISPASRTYPRVYDNSPIFTKTFNNKYVGVIRIILVGSTMVNRGGNAYPYITGTPGQYDIWGIATHSVGYYKGEIGNYTITIERPDSTVVGRSNGKTSILTPSGVLIDINYGSYGSYTAYMGGTQPSTGTFIPFCDGCLKGYKNQFTGYFLGYGSVSDTYADSTIDDITGQFFTKNGYGCVEIMSYS